MYTCTWKLSSKSLWCWVDGGLGHDTVSHYPTLFDLCIQGGVIKPGLCPLPDRKVATVLMLTTSHNYFTMKLGRRSCDKVIIIDLAIAKLVIVLIVRYWQRPVSHFCATLCICSLWLFLRLNFGQFKTAPHRQFDYIRAPNILYIVTRSVCFRKQYSGLRRFSMTMCKQASVVPDHYKH